MIDENTNAAPLTPEEIQDLRTKRDALFSATKALEAITDLDERQTEGHPVVQAYYDAWREYCKVASSDRLIATVLAAPSPLNEQRLRERLEQSLARAKNLASTGHVWDEGRADALTDALTILTEGASGGEK